MKKGPIVSGLSFILSRYNSPSFCGAKNFLIGYYVFDL
jgi:hypothetical protein